MYGGVGYGQGGFAVVPKQRSFFSFASIKLSTVISLATYVRTKITHD
jgi:hypothetical protein